MDAYIATSIFEIFVSNRTHAFVQFSLRDLFDEERHNLKFVCE